VVDGAGWVPEEKRVRVEAVNVLSSDDPEASEDREDKVLASESDVREEPLASEAKDVNDEDEREVKSDNADVSDELAEEIGAEICGRGKRAASESRSA
jgi:hypothetical protein